MELQFITDEKISETSSKGNQEKWYHTLIFEIESLFLNDDRHLNNIAVIYDGKKYSYCPVFDNGASLLSNTQISQMDIMPRALISVLKARPFNTSFTRQMNSAGKLFGKQLHIKSLSKKQIAEIIKPMLEYYPERDRWIISDRVIECIFSRQKYFT